MSDDDASAGFDAPPGPDGPSGTVDASGDPDGPPGASPCVPAVPPTQCSDCVDNDGDGAIDGADPECTLARDNDESSFATGIAGDNMDPNWQDCFFDGNSGGGDDGCRYHTCCLVGGCTPGQQADSCAVTAECVASCGDLTVPGCDCFGCCTLCDDLGCLDVVTNPAIAPDCQYESFRDPTRCPPCTQSSECGTPCGGEDCVLCPGQDPSDLPPECTVPTCPAGQSACTTTADCGTDQFCSNGCCIFQVP